MAFLDSMRTCGADQTAPKSEKEQKPVTAKQWSLRNWLLKFFFNYHENEPVDTAPLVNLPTAQRRTIAPYWQGQWARPYSEDNLYMRRHVGESPMGFHPGIEISGRRAKGLILWGQEHPTPESARMAADEMQRRKLNEINERTDEAKWRSSIG